MNLSGLIIFVRLWRHYACVRWAVVGIGVGVAWDSWAQTMELPIGAVAVDPLLDFLSRFGMPGAFAFAAYHTGRMATNLQKTGVPIRVTFDAASIEAAREAWERGYRDAAGRTSRRRDSDPPTEEV